MEREMTLKKQNSASEKGVILASTGACLWGIMGLFVRNLIASGMTSIDISLVRCVLAGTVMLLFYVLKKPQELNLPLKGILISMIYGAFSYGLCFCLYNIAVSRVPVGVAIVLMYTSPIWVTMISIVFMKVKPQKIKVAAIFVCLFGAVLVSEIYKVGTGGVDLVGIIAGLASAICMACQIAVPQYFSKTYKRETMLVYGFLGAALSVLFFADIGNIHQAVLAGGFNVYVNMIGIGILCTLFANGSFVKATNYIDATSVSIISGLEVVCGCILGFVVYNETLSFTQLLGAVIIMVGAIGPNLIKKK